MGSKCKLLSKVGDAFIMGGRKITVVGSGFVGTAVTACLLTQKVTNEVCLVDVLKDKAAGEMMDLQHGATFLNNATITSGSDLSCTACSNICIIAAGVPQQAGQSAHDLLKCNVEVVKSIVPKLLEYSPDAHVLMITNPVDVLSYVAWKESGLPANRVIGTGTLLDSCRFRCFIAERLGIASGAIQGWVIGENGNSSVPCYSSVNVGGTYLCDIHPEFGKDNDPEKWNEITEKVRKAKCNLLSLKNSTSWGIGLCAAHISQCILDNLLTTCPVSTNCKGLYGLNEDLFMSLPCVLGINGVSSIIKPKLSSEESEGLQKSAEILLESQKKIKC